MNDSEKLKKNQFNPENGGSNGSPADPSTIYKYLQLHSITKAHEQYN